MTQMLQTLPKIGNKSAIGYSLLAGGISIGVGVAQRLFESSKFDKPISATSTWKYSDVLPIGIFAAGTVSMMMGKDSGIMGTVKRIAPALVSAAGAIIGYKTIGPMIVARTTTAAFSIPQYQQQPFMQYQQQPLPQMPENVFGGIPQY
jgi:hypothetical protein